MNLTFKSLPLVLLLIWCTGCLSSYVVEGGGEKAAQSGKETVVGNLYGINYGERKSVKCPGDLGLYKVEVNHNGLYVIASFLSLGFYVPQDVQWWCQKEIESGGNIWNPGMKKEKETIKD